MEKLLRDRRLYDFLEQVDRDIANQVQFGRCEHCGAVLHRGDFSRKPRGGPPHWDKRYSFCCSRDGCRKRKTPPSVRFLGRKVFVGVVVILVSAMMHGSSDQRLGRLCQALPIDRGTIKRWQIWWTDMFVQLPFWKGARGRFANRLAEARMPFSLFEAFDARQIHGLVKLMKFLSPVTTASCADVLVM